MARRNLLPDPAGQEFVGLSVPPDWNAVFRAGGPLELEIGSGAGGFALAYAERFPSVRYIALEWRKKYARELDRRARKRGIENIRVIECDARAEVPRLFTPGSLAAIHLQFPDPWWKRAHQKRSILQPDFCRLLYQLMAPGGVFDLRTDVESRARQMIACLEGAGFVNPCGAGEFHPPEVDEIPSARERRYLISTGPVYRARLRKL
jgi:tRNA (guanine-N7-)-methyltransferase